MTGLMPYVRRFARTPAVTTFKAKVGADNIDQLIKQFGYEKTQNYANSICDLAAYTVMRIAIGSTRMKELESIEGNGETRDGRGRIGRYTDAAAFREHMDAWMERPGPGVVQFKFDANSGVHTFAAERMWPTEGAASFQVYQAYQGGYRLSDFLGLTDARPFLGFMLLIPYMGDYDAELGEEKSHDLDYGPPPASANEATQASWKRYNDKIVGELTRQLGCIAETGNDLREPLSAISFREKVVAPLASMRDGGASSGAYQSLTGHQTKNSQPCGTLLTLSSDFHYIDMEFNFRSLSQADDVESGFVEL